MSSGSSRAQLGVVLFLLLAGAVAARYMRVEGPHALVLLVALLGWLALFSLATLGLGVPLWRRLTGEPPRGVEAWLVSAVSGATGLAAVAGVLGAVGLLRSWILIVVLLAAAAAGSLALVRARPALAPPPLSFPVFVLGFVAVVTLLAAATPSPFYDQVHYHLAFPERWLRAGEIEVFSRHSYSYLAANMGLLYTYALAGPGAWGAQAIHWWMGICAAAAAFSIARKLGATSAGAWWAAAFVAATPSLLLSSTWAASDLAVAAFGAVACSMVLDALPPGRERPAGWYALAGLLCGAAFGSKYVAATSVILPVGLILLGALLLDRRIVRPLAWSAGLAVAILPWAARNIWLTGNPLYPFFSSVFSRLLPGVSTEGMAQAAAGIAGEREASSFLATLTMRTFEPIGAAGWIGPLWLILLPLWIAGLFYARRKQRSLLLALGVLAAIVAWTQFHQLGRYLAAALVLGAAGAAAAWEQLLAAAGGVLRRATALLMAFLVLWSVQGGLSESLFTRIACTFGRSEPRELLERYVTYWAALPIVNDELPQDARVLLVGEPRAYGIERDVVLEDAFRTPYLIEAAERSGSTEEMASLLRERGITHLLYNRQEAARIAQMRALPAYFAGAEPATVVRLQEFLDGCLDLVGEAGPVRVYGLEGRCTSARGSS